MRRRRAVAATGWAAGLLALAVPIVFGARWDGYRPRGQYISELGARGAPDGVVVSVAFAVIGVLVLAFVVLALASVRHRPLALVGLIGVAGVGKSYAIAAVARCDPGCPEPGTTTAQDIHNLAGVLGYGAAFIGILLFGIALRRAAGWRRIAAASIVLAPAMLVASAGAAAENADRGLWQRVVEVGIFAWIAAVGWRVRTPVDTPDL